MVDYQILRPGNLLFEEHERVENNNLWKKAWGDPTTTLLFGEKNVIVDPGYGPYRERMRDVDEHDTQLKILQLQMSLLDLSMRDIDFVFITHHHLDHMNLAHRFEQSGAVIIDPWEGDFMSGVEIIRTPGHSDDHHILKFHDGNYDIVVAGDAVINLDYYRHLSPYWMNGYSDNEIWQTRESMYQISRMADIIIPGHGQPFLNDEVVKEKIAKLWEETQNR